MKKILSGVILASALVTSVATAKTVSGSTPPKPVHEQPLSMAKTKSTLLDLWCVVTFDSGYKCPTPTPKKVQPKR